MHQKKFYFANFTKIFNIIILFFKNLIIKVFFTIYMIHRVSEINFLPTQNDTYF